MATHTDLEFAGAVRRFDLLAPRPRDDLQAQMAALSDRMARVMPGEVHMPRILIEEMGGNLSLLADAASQNTLSHSDVRLIIVTGLACGDSGRIPQCRDLFQRESRERPFGEMVALAVQVITAAYAGADAAEEAAA